MLSDSGGAFCRRCHCLVESLFVTSGHHCTEKHGIDVTEVALLVAQCKTHVSAHLHLMRTHRTRSVVTKEVAVEESVSVDRFPGWHPQRNGARIPVIKLSEAQASRIKHLERLSLLREGDVKLENSTT